MLALGFLGTFGTSLDIGLWADIAHIADVAILPVLGGAAVLARKWARREVRAEARAAQKPELARLEREQQQLVERCLTLESRASEAERKHVLLDRLNENVLVNTKVQRRILRVVGRLAGDVDELKTAHRVAIAVAEDRAARAVEQS